jgi:hypothetical protein
MKVIKVNVSAGRVVPHPFTQYANLKPQITVKAIVEEGEDWQAVTKELQAHAEQLVEEHKDNLVRNLEEIENLSRKQREIASLSSGIRRAQAQLDAIRKEHPQLALAEGEPETDADDDDAGDERSDSEIFRVNRRNVDW